MAIEWQFWSAMAGSSGGYMAHDFRSKLTVPTGVGESFTVILQSMQAQLSFFTLWDK
jgi:hypothetical protein